MSSLTQIKSAIKTILESVNDLGKVYYGYVYLNSQLNINFVTVDNRINAIGFIQRANAPETEESFELEDIARNFLMVFYYEHNQLNDDTKSSFIKADIISEAIQQAFNSNETLNGTVSYHDKLSLISNNLVSSFTNKFVHMLTYQLVTHEEYEQT